MDKYNVSLTSRALRDLDDIYVYISQTLLVPETALGLILLFTMWMKNINR